MKFHNLIFTGLLSILLISGCTKKESARKEVIRPVKYEIVGKNNAQKSRTFSGVISASDEIELSFRSTGVITTLNAKVGERVKKGDLLMKLDNVQAQLAYEQSLSALSSAKSAMNTAKSSLERSKALYEKGSQSLSDYESAKNVFQKALDNYESAKRKKDIDQSNISYGFIYAPKSGTIANVSISLNETVSSGQTVAVLNAGDELNVIVGLPESVINNVSVGMEAKLEFASVENRDFSGSVVEMSPIIDTKSSTFPVKVDISSPTQELKPGMVANVTFTFGSNEVNGASSIIVPVNAVGEDGDGNFVFIIELTDENEGIAKKQTVSLGELTNNGFLVKDGLEEEQLIATAGLQTLLDGQKVKLQ